MGAEFHFGKMKTFSGWMVVMIVQHGSVANAPNCTLRMVKIVSCMCVLAQ